MNDNFGVFAQAGIGTALNYGSELAKGWQAIALEMTDYSKRTLEQSTATAERLATARSFEQAFAVQTAFAKATYDDFVQQASRINAIMASLTKQTMEPLASAMPRKF